MKEILDIQQEHWDTTFSHKPEMFGSGHSEAAEKAADLFEKEGRTKLLELGAGQGRDTLFFAGRGFHITALDYSQSAVDALAAKAGALGVGQRLTVMRYDARELLTFEPASFDACYSHMLYCMALTIAELARLSAEVWRVLRPGGLNVYTVRHTGDAHYGTGIHRGEGMYEVGGFVVHFFTKELVQRLALGYDVLSVDEFAEGGLPRRLYRVTLRKRAESV